MACLPKQKRFAYTKNFSVNQILQNLKTYKLATGDVHSSELAEARSRYGNDEGKVYGALVLGEEHEVRRGYEYGNLHHRKRKRFRKKKGLKKSKAMLNTEKTKLERDKITEEFETSTGEIEQKGQQRVPPILHTDQITDTSIKLVADYSDSEDEEERSNDGTKSPAKSVLEVPLSIQNMFEDFGESSKSCSTSTTQESCGSEDDTLGFFEPADSDCNSSVDDVSCDKPHPKLHYSNNSGTHDDTSRPQQWDEQKLKWKFPPSSLSTYVCWKCNNVGHFPKDCTVEVNMAGKGRPVSNKKVRISSNLQSLYSQCRDIKKRRQDHCIECGVHSNLACCLECGSVLCDGRGHLTSHLLSNPSHQNLFSYKLGRLNDLFLGWGASRSFTLGDGHPLICCPELKCSKSSCEVTSCYDLYVCSHCLGKAFSQHYSMVHATWSRSGLKLIPNALCCEEHFEWHRMNCPNTSEEQFISQAGLSHPDSQLISDCYF